MTDMVNSPPHYGIGDTGLEACDVVRPLMTEKEWEKHCLATALYYLLRLGRKDDSAQDAAKAIWWLTWIAKGDPREVDAQPPAEDLPSPDVVWPTVQTAVQGVCCKKCGFLHAYCICGLPHGT